MENNRKLLAPNLDKLYGYFYNDQNLSTNFTNRRTGN